eukprot:TRINITY_DN12770_c0_g1_i1.p1 TRINITY_DN12770_c0_g1~~TRINITY_DN12770_c0_g1_i1.p1  ORF type:complete len:473 (-),score=55.22 TRINITY_DN12770_c0_g1_i1:4-1422(-)
MSHDVSSPTVVVIPDTNDPLTISSQIRNREKSPPTLKRTHSALISRLTEEEIETLARAHRFNSYHEPRLNDFVGRRCCGKTKCCTYNVGRNCFRCATIGHFFVSFWSVFFRMTTLLVVSLAVAGTWLCHYFDLRYNMPISLISTGIVFPISFTLQNTVQRRERVLLDVASLKSSIIGLYIMSREWPSDDRRAELRDVMRHHLDCLLVAVSDYLTHKTSDVYQIYIHFDNIFYTCEELRKSDDWIRSVISRGYQYVRYAMNDFERLRTVADFRTPSTFRSYGFIWLITFPALFSPYFAFLGQDPVDKAVYHLVPSLYSAILSALVFSILQNVIDDTEDPFDGVGLDDLNMEMVKEPSFLMFQRTRADLDRIKKIKRKLKVEKSKSFSRHSRAKSDTRKVTKSKGTGKGDLVSKEKVREGEHRDHKKTREDLALELANEKRKVAKLARELEERKSVSGSSSSGWSDSESEGESA